ncbi:MAG: M23 family metallopeptidase, partial [Spirochaetes bacterium]|nr:M23 family metallopeptidase [Spirochaetota bacterium]
EAGLTNREVFDIVNKLAEVADTRKLQKRDTYSISTGQDGQFNMLLLNQGFKHYYVANLAGSLVAGVSDVEIKTRVKSTAGEIKGSLFNSMLQEGLTVPLIVDFTDAFSWTIDFNSETQNGDKYAALWEENYTADGTITSQDLLAAYYKGQNGLTYAFYYNGEFYDETGKVSKKMFLKAPISFRSYRISSRFSYGRLHPILRIRRPHLGIDYAAPAGTPVDAVADGTVAFVGRKGGFGNYVEIKHANDYLTAYGHLKSFGKGIKKGARVTQGQTVGYVGSTGLSTGPHLDFRIKHKNKFVDFLKMKNRNNAVRSVSKEERKDFEELKALYLQELEKAARANEPAAPQSEDKA